MHRISHERISPEQAHHWIATRQPLELSIDATQSIVACRKYLERRMADSDQLLYGINTGFGSLCNIRISHDETEQLQHNLVKSHACGAGEEVPAEIVRAMLFLKIRNMAYGHSGVRLELVQRLIDLYNADVLPVVYQQGSLGASPRFGTAPRPPTPAARTMLRPTNTGSVIGLPVKRTPTSCPIMTA